MRRKKVLENNATTFSNVQMEQIDSVKREKNTNLNTIKKRIRRLNMNYRKSEQEADTLRKRIKRSDPEYRRVENERNNIRKRIRRSDPLYRIAEQAADTQRKRMKRSDPEYRKLEQAANTQRKREKRGENNLYQKDLNNTKVEEKFKSVKRSKKLNIGNDIVPEQSSFTATIIEEKMPSYMQDTQRDNHKHDHSISNQLIMNEGHSNVVRGDTYIPNYGHNWDSNADKRCETIMGKQEDPVRMTTY